MRRRHRKARAETLDGAHTLRPTVQRAQSYAKLAARVDESIAALERGRIKARVCFSLSVDRNPITRSATSDGQRQAGKAYACSA